MKAGRVPLMRPSSRSGLGAQAALHEQVRVTPDGAVEVGGGPATLRWEPGRVQRTVLLEPDDTERLLGADAHHGGALVLLGAQDTPLLALALLDWAPPAPVDLTTLRETTGVEALCRALELPLEPADPQRWDAPALRAVAHRPGPQPRWPGRAGLPIAVVAVALAMLTLFGASAAPGTDVDQVIGDANGGVLALASAVLALLVGVPMMLGWGAVARSRRVAPAQLTGSEVVVDARPAGPVPARVARHQLRLTHEALLLRRFDSVVVLPGPAVGGVQQAVLEPAAVRLRDRHGRLYSSLSTELWCGDPAARELLRDQLADGGLDVLEAPVDAADAVDLEEMSTDGTVTRLRSRPADRGELFAGPSRLVAFATGAAAVASYAPVESGADWQFVPAATLGLVCTVSTVVLLARELLQGRRRRREAALVDPRTLAAAP